jgi:hypothetical protein
MALEMIGPMPGTVISLRQLSSQSWGMDRPIRITFADMREQGVRGPLIYCAHYRCSHSIAISGDRWPDDVRLSDIAPRLICAACGHRGADVRPDFNWNKQPVKMMGYRSQCSG